MKVLGDTTGSIEQALKTLIPEYDCSDKRLPKAVGYSCQRIVQRGGLTARVAELQEHIISLKKVRARSPTRHEPQGAFVRLAR